MRDGKRSGRAHACAIMVMLMMLSTYCFGLLAVDEDAAVAIPASSEYAYRPVHDPIIIEGDDGFTEENGVVSGNGTESEPYIISGWSIDVEDLIPWTSAIEIVNTTAYFTIMNNSIARGDNEYAFRGIYLENVTQGSIKECVIDSVYHCIGVQSSSNVSIIGNTISGADAYFGTAISASDNVTFAENMCHYVSIRAGTSSNLSIIDNSVYTLVSDNSPVGMDVYLDECYLCRIERNTLWLENASDMRNGLISIGSSSMCIIDDNEIGKSGIGFSGAEIHHYTTHVIGPNNTACNLPVVAYMNVSGVRIDEGGTGGLIIINCTDVRLQDVSYYGDACRIGMYYCSDIEMSDCTFEESRDAFSIWQSSDVRIRHNAFINTSLSSIQYCSDFVFSDNDLTLCNQSFIGISGVTNCTVQNNLFGTNSGNEIHISSTTNLVMKGNQLPFGGFSIGGQAIEHFNSHTIDDSNVFANGKPILYIKNITGEEIDMKRYGQLIMANCTDVTARGMITGVNKAIQICYSKDVTVKESKTYGVGAVILESSDGVTLTEIDFVDPKVFMDIYMSHNITIFHCNLMGHFGVWIIGGKEGYYPTGIRWDNGYPDGGNYYELWPKEDNYSGPAQDVLGADGICDWARNHIIGEDRYPLMEPYAWDAAYYADDGGWDDMAIWLSAIGAIVLASSLISYVLFIRPGPKGSRDGESGDDDRTDT